MGTVLVFGTFGTGATNDIRCNLLPSLLYGAMEAVCGTTTPPESTELLSYIDAYVRGDAIRSHIPKFTVILEEG